MNCQRTQTLSGITPGTENRTKTVPKYEKPYNTVRFQESIKSMIRSDGRSGFLTPDVIDTLKDIKGQRTDLLQLSRFIAKNFTHSMNCATTNDVNIRR